MSIRGLKIPVIQISELEWVERDPHWQFLADGSNKSMIADQTGQLVHG